MMDFFLQRMDAARAEEALVTVAGSSTYDELLAAFQKKQDWLAAHQIRQGKVVSFDGDYSLDSISLFLALAANGNIIVPLSKDSQAHHQEFRDIAQTEYDILLHRDQPSLAVTKRKANHFLYEELKKQRTAGLVLFSSGSTGKSKGIVHDLYLLMEKFQTLRNKQRMLIFLQLDHIGGINSLLYSLANGGTIIVPENRSPSQVCQVIQRHKADLLPTSPTFLNLILLSRVYEQYDLSSLELITYGTETMPQSTLDQFTEIFPEVQLQQTYGLSELGILRTKSKNSDSLWVKIGGDEFQTKIVDNRLWVRSKSSMIGYLNAPSPFDDEGYFDTGDFVECDGEWIRILGRESEIINVGGFKVFPAEVESVLLAMDNVEDVVVFGESHAFTGQIVVAKVKLVSPEPMREFKGRMLQYCKNRLQKYKVPGKVYLCEETIHNERFKRMRRFNKEWQ